MHFVSEINANLAKVRIAHPFAEKEDSQSSVFLLQSGEIPRSIGIRGRSSVKDFSKEYYMSLVEGFYRSNGNDTKSLGLLHRILANHTAQLSNPKFQLKLFYLACAKIIAIQKQLAGRQLNHFYKNRVVKFKAISEDIFGGKREQQPGQTIQEG